MPRVRKEFNAAEHSFPNREGMIALEGPAAVTVDDIETVQPSRLKEKAEIEKFMHDDLEILIFPATEKYPEDPVHVAVNGKDCYIYRNVKTRIKRKYVFQLCKAKAEGISQNTEADDPADFNKLSITTSLRYPFTVVTDPAGVKGHTWLQEALRSA